MSAPKRALLLGKYHTIPKTCENAFEKVSSTWDKFQDKVDPLDEAEDDEELFENEIVIEKED